LNDEDKKEGRRSVMKDFECFKPATIQEALRLLREGGKGARLLAGGTELLNEIRLGKSLPERVIDLKAVRDLDFLHVSSDGVRIGALYRVRDAGRSTWLRESAYGAISRAAGTLGSPQLGNKATIVGSLCGASPSADLIPPLVALDAWAWIVGRGAERRVTVEHMLLGPGRTTLEEGEIIVEVEIPCMPQYAGCSYCKLSPRKSLDLAVVGVAVMVRMDETFSKFVDARVVLGAVAPTTMRAKKAESILRGAPVTQPIIDEAAKAAAEESRPVDDLSASAWYRRRMVEMAVKRAAVSSLELARTRRQRDYGENEHFRGGVRLSARKNS
jgi:carbon-monoxide dehydrogenase medium subunit